MTENDGSALGFFYNTDIYTPPILSISNLKIHTEPFFSPLNISWEHFSQYTLRPTEAHPSFHSILIYSGSEIQSEKPTPSGTSLHLVIPLHNNNLFDSNPFTITVTPIFLTWSPPSFPLIRLSLKNATQSDSVWKILISDFFSSPLPDSSGGYLNPFPFSQFPDYYHLSGSQTKSISKP